jgi:arylformamidase
MSDRRVLFDFEITFENGGGLQGQEFRLDIHEDAISDEDLAALVVDDLRLLMVETVRVFNKRYVEEPHKRT